MAQAFSAHCCRPATNALGQSQPRPSRLRPRRGRQYTCTPQCFRLHPLSAEPLVKAWKDVTTRLSQGTILSQAALFGVAILWGSYTPALRYLFLSDDAAMMNALQACLPAPFLAASGMAAYLTRKKPRPMSELSMSEYSLASLDDVYEPALTIDRVEPAASPSGADILVVTGLGPPRLLTNDFERACAQALNWRSDSLLVAGAELGMWLFLDYSLEVLGVQLISATKAAFLNQATVLITPVLVHMSGEAVRRGDWAACSLALLGSVLVASDSFELGPAAAGAAGALAEVGAAPVVDNALGYTYMLLSAVFFAMSTVRMGRYSTQFSSLDLALASTCSLALLSLLWVLASFQGHPDGPAASVSMLQHLFTDPTSLAVLIWVGVGPGALAAFLQAAGQQNVAPAQAQVIYATTPLFASALAMLVLDASDEAMGVTAWVGAALMLGASLLASAGATQHSD